MYQKEKVMKKLAVLVVLIIFLGCEKENSVPQNDELTIIGSWELFSQYNPWTQDTIILSEIGHFEVWDFQSNDTVYQYLDNELTRTKSYVLKEEVHPNDSTMVIRSLKVGESPGFDFIELTPKKLIIDQTPYDGPRSHFKRID